MLDPLFAADGEPTQQLPWWVTAVLAAVYAGDKLWFFIRRRLRRESEAKALSLQKIRAGNDKLTAAERKVKLKEDRDEQDRVIGQWQAIAEEHERRRAAADLEHRAELVRIEKERRQESAELRTLLQTEVIERFNCQARLARLEGMLVGAGHTLPSLPPLVVPQQPPPLPPLFTGDCDEHDAAP